MTREDPAHPPKRPANPLADLDECEGLLEDLGASERTHELRKSAAEWSAREAFRALRAVACSITGNLDLRTLVKQILDAALHTLGAERGILFLGRGEDAGLVPIVALNIAGEELEEIEQVSTTILRRGQQGEVLVSENAAQDPRFRDVPSISIKEVRAVLCAPLTTRGVASGVIYLDSRCSQQAFPRDAGRLLEAFASLAAVALENARRHGEVIRENSLLRRRMMARESFERILTLSPRMSTLLEKAALAAKVDAPILIVGESGTGKELLARSIHDASPRALNPFAAQSCSAIPPKLMEACLFGQAGSSAGRELPGLLREADRGTLYLAEIAALDLDLQAKLLRTIESGCVTALGTRREIRVDVHLISASGRDLRAEIRAGRFLEELYHLLGLLELQIPPLRERPEDIPLLVNHFVGKHIEETGQERAAVSFTPEALERLQGLPWRGNARELESVIRRLLAFTRDERITADQLDNYVASCEISAQYLEAPDWSASSVMGQIRPFAEQEREALRAALRRTGGNKSKAARLLGLHRNTLLRRIKKLGVLDG